MPLSSGEVAYHKFILFGRPGNATHPIPKEGDDTMLSPTASQAADPSMQHADGSENGYLDLKL